MTGAYIGRIGKRLFLVVQEGTGSAYFRISPKPIYLINLVKSISKEFNIDRRKLPKLQSRGISR